MQTMASTPADRLRLARERRFASAQEAADAFGWNPVTYRSHENGIRNFPLTTARKYAAAFGTTATELLGLRGGDSQGVSTVINVPLVARAAAGSFRADEGISDFEDTQVPAVSHASVPPEVQYAVAVEGPSVNKRIPDGAFAICAPYDRFPGGARHGSLVHVVRERAGLYEHTIKEVHYTRDGMILMPCSTDPRYQEQLRIAADEDGASAVIRGVVIGIFQAL